MSSIATAGPAWHRTSPWRLALALLGTAGVFATLIIVRLPGLSPDGTRALGVFSFALCWWVSRIVEDSVTALLVLILIALERIVTTTAVLAVLGSASVWTVIAVLVISRAVTKSGVGKRIAGVLVRHRTSRPAVRLLEVMMAVHALAFVIPSGAGRTAVALPIARELSDSVDTQPQRSFTRAAAIAMAYVPAVSSVGLVTGAPSVIYAVGLLKASLGYDFSYTSWLIVFMPVSVALSLMLWVVLLVVFHVGIRSTPQRESLQRLPKGLTTKMTFPEWKLCGVLMLLITGWFFGSQLSMPIVLTALIGMALLVLPGVGVLKWSEALEASDLSLVLLYAGGLGLATALVGSGAAAWMARLIVDGIGSVGVAPIVDVLAVVLLTLVLNLGISTNVATMAIVLPVAIAIGQAAHLNPLWMGMVAVLTNWMGLFMPYQSVSLLMSYGSGQYTRKDLAMVALPFAVVSTIVIVFATLVFWPRLGYRP